MVRKAEFDDNSFILAAIDLVGRGGPAAATMSAIAATAGAPTGSIYHRFRSRSALLGGAWLHVLTAMSDEILPSLQAGKADQAVTALIHWATAHPNLARIIMLYGENDLVDDALPKNLHHQLNRVNQSLGAGLSALLKHQNKALTPSNLALVNFAIFDGPIAALKPFLRTKTTSLALKGSKCHVAALACSQASLALLE